MSADAISVRCPHCQALYEATAADLSGCADCESCGKSLTFTRAEAAAGPDATALAGVQQRWEGSISSGAAPDGTLFYAMKEVRGTPWHKAIVGKSLEENLEILLKVSDAVAYAHSKGVVHRDLKPENVMLGDYGEVLVMDWGLAISVSAEGKAERLMKAADAAGTPAYLAPEMALGEGDRIGPASAVYGECNEAISGCRQALALWVGNVPAVKRLRCARETLAQRALERGDLALASSEVEAIRTECRELALEGAAGDSPRRGSFGVRVASPAGQAGRDTALAGREAAAGRSAPSESGVKPPQSKDRLTALGGDPACTALAERVRAALALATRRQRDRAEQALAEKRQAQAGETAAIEAKDIIAKAKAEVEQMKRREEYYSAIAQAARHIQDRHFEIA